MTEKDLINLLKTSCEILTFNTDYFVKRLEFFIKNGLKESIKDIILNDIEAFEDEEDEIALEELKTKYIERFLKGSEETDEDEKEDSEELKEEEVIDIKEI